MQDKKIEDMELEELLEVVEQIESKFRLGEATEDDVVEEIKKIAKILNIPTESG